MTRLSARKLSPKESLYWSNICIASSQVFLGIAAVTIFAGAFDIYKFFVIVLNLILSISLGMLGWRIVK